MNPFVNFTLERQQFYKNSNQPLPHNLSKVIAKEWRELSEKQREKYQSKTGIQKMEILRQQMTLDDEDEYQEKSQNLKNKHQSQQIKKQNQIQKNTNTARNTKNNSNFSENEPYSTQKISNLSQYIQEENKKSSILQQNKQQQQRQQELLLKKNQKKSTTQKKQQNLQKLQKKLIQSRKKRNSNEIIDEKDREELEFDSFSDYYEGLQEDINQNAQATMPKLPPNPYLRFHIEQANRIKNRFPNLTQNQITKYIKLDWQTIEHTRKEKYLKSYQQDIKMYNELKEMFREITYGPKKPMTPYFIFHKEQIGIMQKQFPTKPIIEITQLIAKQWKNLSEEQKLSYQQSYEEEFQNYKKKLELFETKENNYVQNLEFQNLKQQYENHLHQTIETYKNRFVINKVNKSSEKMKTEQIQEEKKEEELQEVSEEEEEEISQKQQIKKQKQPESVISQQDFNGKVKFLIKWKNQTQEENSWEDQKDLELKYPEFIKEFEKFSEENRIIDIDTSRKLRSRGHNSHKSPKK
ncbi:High mobility group box domain [Pseudocohnilembus persalinus]|uniref:High mobility group box domain n=1 Tax=Pseudocohnilembus persalinus TaxID=266149 RepID=A0A0V0QXK4_PSEPJ|nr:High mobility group box domain [Pseudocohnilembus persalinus]|eukprot:KRX07084.1 High mobility group box domain [Pseudocohnilembus persalinus]